MKKSLLALFPLMGIVACSTSSQPKLNYQIKEVQQEVTMSENLNIQLLNIKIASVPNVDLEKGNVTNILKQNQYKLIADTNILCASNKEGDNVCGFSLFEDSAYVKQVTQESNSVTLSAETEKSGVNLQSTLIQGNKITFKINSILINNFTQNKLGEQKISTTKYTNMATISPESNIYVVRPTPLPSENKNIKNLTFNNQNSYIYIFTYKDMNKKIEKIKSLNTNYTISGGDTNQKPLVIFDDGNKTYIRFSQKLEGDMPYITTDKNELLYYRVVGNSLFIDGVWNNFQMIYSNNKVVEVKKLK